MEHWHEGGHILAQDVAYIHLTPKDGLPSSTIYRVIQDRKGFVWFCTNAGVSRYDGVDFENFSLDDGLQSTDILVGMGDSRDRVWFGSSNGEVCYFHNGTFHSSLNSPILAQIKEKDPIIHFYEDSNGNVWCVPTGNGLIKITRDTVFRFTRENGYDFSVGNAIWERNGKVFCLTSKSSKIVPDSSHIISVIPSEFRYSPVKGATFIGNNKLFRATPDIIVFSNLDSLTKNRVLDPQIYFDLKSKKIWKGINNGIFDPYRKILWLGSFQRGVFMFRHGNNNPPFINILPHKKISSISQDTEMNIWIGTIGEGAYLITTLDTKVFLKSNSPNFPRYEVIKALDSTGIWLGSEHDLFKYKNGKKTYFNGLISDNRLTKISGINIINNEMVLAWDDFNVFQIKEKGFEKITELPNGAKKLVTNDPRGTIIFSTHRGTFYRDSIIWKSLWRINNSNRQLRAFQIVYYSTDTALIGTQNGVKVLINDSLFNLTNNKKISGNIKGLQMDESKVIWGITGEFGAFAFSKNQSPITIQAKDGLPSNICHSICLGAENEVWVGTNKGLARIKYNPKNLAQKPLITTIDETDGLPSNEINAVGYYNDSVFVGTNEGLAIFDPKNIHRDSPPPPTHITHFKVNGQDVACCKPTLLGFNQNDITISYVGISFRNRNRVSYTYALEGADLTWKETKSNVVKYPSLPAGDYTFKVRSKIDGGPQSLNTASLSFTILKPWYQSNWFLSTIGLIALSTLGGFILARIQAIRKQNEYLKQIAELRTQALGLQMNPHFIFNTLNSIHYFINNNDKASARRYLSRFGKLIRGILENSNRSGISIEQEVELLEIYLSLENLRLESKMTYSIEVDDRIDKTGTEIPVMVIQPFVENAIWHGLSHKPEAGNINIKFNYHEKYIVCSVEDNGVGRHNAEGLKKTSKHLSLSTRSIKTRLEMLHQETGITEALVYTDLFDPEDHSPTGTKVEIFLPLDF